MRPTQHLLAQPKSWSAVASYPQHETKSLTESFSSLDRPFTANHLQHGHEPTSPLYISSCPSCLCPHDRLPHSGTQQAVPSRHSFSLSHKLSEALSHPLATGSMHISLCSTVRDTDFLSCPKPLRKVFWTDVLQGVIKKLVVIGAGR